MATELFDYLESRDDADGLIEEFGAAASLRRNVVGGTVFDPTLTPTDYPTLAVKVEFTLRQVQGGRVEDTDERWLVAAGPLDALGITSLATPDLLVAGGRERPILEAKPLDPAGTVVMYDCHIRF
jgi:hypothetical protein